MKNTICIASDHGGFETKEIIEKHLLSKGYVVKDFGTHSTYSVDYPDFIHPLASAVENGEFPLGIILCGSGNGAVITANKHQGIRAALCWNGELASLARQHNDANVCAIPARFVSAELAVEIVDCFLSASFEGGRHIARVSKIAL